MAAKKPFWKTTPGILIGCFSVIIVLLLCVCAGLGAFVFFSPSDNTASATNTPVIQISTSNIVTNAVMARDAQGDTFEPVGITDSFAANQSVFHAIVTIKNAPKGTAVKVAWFTTSGKAMGEYELATEGSRNLDFSFAPDAGTLPGGKYRAEVYVNGKLDRTLNFTVADAPVTPTSVASKSSSSSASVLGQLPTARASSSSSSVVSKSSASSSASPKSTGLVASLTMAENTQGDTKEPVNPTTVFKPTANFHAVVRTNNAPAGTNYAIKWLVTDVGSAAAPNTLIDEDDVDTSGTRNIDFSVRPISTWPIGTYRVEVSVNGVLDTIKTFSVSGTASSAPAPTPDRVLTECGVIPAGKGGLLVTNWYGPQINYTIGGTLYKIDGSGGQKAIYLAPGKQNYSANIPGVGEKQGSLEIVAGQCLTQSWAN